MTAMSRLGKREEEDKVQAEHGPDKAEVLGPTWCRVSHLLIDVTSSVYPTLW